MPNINLGEALKIKAREQGIQWLGGMDNDQKRLRKNERERSYYHKKRCSQ